MVTTRSFKTAKEDLRARFNYGCLQFWFYYVGDFSRAHTIWWWYSSLYSIRALRRW